MNTAKGLIQKALIEELSQLFPNFVYYNYNHNATASIFLTPPSRNHILSLYFDDDNLGIWNGHKRTAIQYADPDMIEQIVTIIKAAIAKYLPKEELAVGKMTVTCS